MNKLLTKIVGVALGASMAIGVGVAVVANSGNDAKVVNAAVPSGNELLFTINFKDNGTDSSTALTAATFYSSGVTSVTDKNGSTVTSTFSTAGISGTPSKVYPGNGGLKCGSNKNAASFTLNIPSAYQAKFTYAVINCTNATRNITLTAGGGSATLSSGNSSFGNHDLSISSTSTATTLDVSIASASKTAAYIASIAVYKAAAKTLSSISVSGATTSFDVGDTFSFGGTVTAHYSDSTTANVTSSATFSGYNMNTAGNQTVTVSYTEGGTTKTATYSITVTAASTPYITPAKASTSGYTGQHESLSFTYGNLDGSLSVVSSNTSYVTVESPSTSAGSGTVQINFIAAGSTTVKFYDGSTEMASVNVSVTKTAFTTSPAASATVKTSATTTLTAALNSGGTINWSSDDDSVATVSGGVVTGVAAGTTTITATSADDNTVTADCEVTVVLGPAYETGFESSEGYTSSTTYNNDTPNNHGPSGKQWSVLCGSPTTTQPKTGSQDMHLRYYNSVGETPYMEMTWDVTDGHELTFYAKGHDAARTISVEYSTDSGSNWSSLITDESIPASDYNLVTATIPSYTAKARFRILLTSTVDKKGVFIDDLEITTMAEPTDPSVSITSKDGSGMMSGVIGDVQEVTYTIAHDTGLALNWVLTDTESNVDWESPYVEFLKVGTVDATLTAQLLDSNDVVVAFDTVTFHTLAPSLDVKVNGTSRANYSLYVGDEITITVTANNKPSAATLSWTTDDTEMDYSIFDDSDGSFLATAAGKVKVTVNMMYGGNSIASDSLNVTINALSEPTLVISAGTGKTSYIFGETLDTTDWTAVYTDNHGVEHSDVLGDLVFDSLNFIGTKGIKATYLGTESNTVDVTVTNNGATCETETILEGSGFTSSSMPSGWSQSGAGSDYAASHAPYRLKFDGSGDTVTATVNTSASVIYAQLGIKLVGGQSTCSFTVTAKDSSGNSVATGTLNYTGAQNAVLSDTVTLNNPNGKTVTSIEFYFNKGASNVGVGTGTISIDDTSTFAPNQALAYARYFLEQTDGYCEATISSSVKTALINEYNWMLPESKATFKAATIVRGKGASYENDISEALSRYVNMIEEKGYSDADFLNLGDEVINRANSLNVSILGNIDNSNVAIIVAILSMIAITSVGGYFFLRKKKKEN